MGWGNCGLDTKGRPIGYAFEAKCDHPGCTADIDRGLAYACGEMHGDNDPEGSCEGYFCYDHRRYVDLPNGRAHNVCFDCAAKIPDWDGEGPYDEDADQQTNQSRNQQR